MSISSRLQLSSADLTTKNLSKKRSRTKVRGSLRPTDLLQTGPHHHHHHHHPFILPQQQQQQLLSPHPTYNSKALSLASIASKTDQLTQSNQSFLPSSTSFPFSSSSSLLLEQQQ
ncbi:hypothetical protein PGTUg99_022224 [Puccinia graminis f. sp. tritici]|uniref:Uncharacterized protein n=1 Tax=Puccinia graminis f. sp. tritici TaxID=56615 RepID=A0A5B0PI71_PUCGR|nr:hypothetical protein PGTUg99_022224 [Puccinia graminis f. sp. tritici]